MEVDPAPVGALVQSDERAPLGGTWRRCAIEALHGEAHQRHLGVPGVHLDHLILPVRSRHSSASGDPAGAERAAARADRNVVGNIGGPATIDTLSSAAADLGEQVSDTAHRRHSDTVRPFERDPRPAARVVTPRSELRARPAIRRESADVRPPLLRPRQVAHLATWHAAPHRCGSRSRRARHRCCSSPGASHPRRGQGVERVVGDGEGVPVARRSHVVEGQAGRRHARRRLPSVEPRTWPGCRRGSRPQYAVRIGASVSRSWSVSSPPKEVVDGGSRVVEEPMHRDDPAARIEHTAIDERITWWSRPTRSLGDERLAFPGGPGRPRVRT